MPPALAAGIEIDKARGFSQTKHSAKAFIETLFSPPAKAGGNSIDQQIKSSESEKSA